MSGAEFVAFEQRVIGCAVLRVLKVRCSEMQRLSERIPSGMLSVITSRTSTKLTDVCAAAREHVAKSRALPEPPICSIANYLFADGRVIAGHMPVRRRLSSELLVLLHLLRIR